MSGRKFHEDWPECVDGGKNYWDLPAPLDDLAYALARNKHDLTDIATITDYYVAYHGQKWVPGGEGGSELEMILLGTLVDGQYFALEAWNDYTGWECQDGIDFVTRDTRVSVIADGLTNDGRGRLGLPPATAVLS